MTNGIRTSDPCGFNKNVVRSSRVRQIPEEGRRTYRPKRCGNNNKDEDNSLKNYGGKTSASFTGEAIANSIREFIYNPLIERITF